MILAYFAKIPPNTPIFLAGAIVLPGHDLLFNWLKEGQDENELIFGGSDSDFLMAYLGYLGCFRAFILIWEIGAFPGVVSGKRGLNWALIGGE